MNQRFLGIMAIGLSSLASGLVQSAELNRKTSAADECKEMDIGGTWRSMKSGRKFRILQNGCVSAKLQDLQRGISYSIDSNAADMTDVPNELLKIFKKHNVPVVSMEYSSDLIPLTNKTTATQLTINMRLAAPKQGFPWAFVDIQAKVSAKISPRSTYRYNSNGYQQIVLHDRLKLEITSLKVAQFVKGDGSVEADKKYAIGANVVLKIVTDYFEEATTEEFERISQ